MALFARAAVAFLLLPGMVAFVVPIVVLRPPAAAREFHSLALAPLAIGAILLLWCVRDFYVSGKGTLAPWSPPRRLVDRLSLVPAARLYDRRGDHVSPPGRAR